MKYTVRTLVVGLFLILAACTTTDNRIRPDSATHQPSVLQPVFGPGLDSLKINMYYRGEMPISEGWSGIPWRTSLRRFLELFPGAEMHQGLKTAWYTGRGEEWLFNHSFPAIYYFDPGNHLIAVSLDAQTSQDTKSVINTLMEKLGVPKDGKPLWTFGNTTIFVYHTFVIVRGVPPE